MNKFYINLDSDVDRREKFLNTDYVRWRATPREEVSDELDKKMISCHNFPRQAHLGRCGCFQSHISLLQHIVKHKLNDVLIVEDDAVLINDLPTDYPQSSITYVGGFIHHQKMTNNSPVKISLNDGFQLVPEGYRILMTMSYIVPNYVVAEEILYCILSSKRYRAIDVMLGNINIDRPYVYYPACFEEEGVVSTIQQKRRKATTNYEWIKY